MTRDWMKQAVIDRKSDAVSPYLQLPLDGSQEEKPSALSGPDARDRAPHARREEELEGDVFKYDTKARIACG